MTFQHREMAAGRWYAFTLAEQMGNIGSEVHRAIVWRTRGEEENFQHAFERALELFDLTLDDPRWNAARKREIGRAREVFCDALWGNNEYKTNLTSLDNYFLQFGIAARADV
ncbi:MAG: hypothetical protein HY437_00040 [Candidatus Magasanikbacteria bacterium]|nr:hypothetical protein [Candidatus Magasanikbacteria bacterium]